MVSSLAQNERIYEYSYHLYTRWNKMTLFKKNNQLASLFHIEKYVVTTLLFDPNPY